MNLSMGLFNNKPKVKAIEALSTTRGSTGGLFKRIDENRELLELLQREAPDFVSSHPWLIGWIESNDHFFTQLADILDIQKPLHVGTNFPRPWPRGPACQTCGKSMRVEYGSCGSDVFLACTGAPACEETENLKPNL